MLRSLDDSRFGFSENDLFVHFRNEITHEKIG